MALLAAAYVAAARFGLLFARWPDVASTIWFPSGLSVAALLFGGVELWPGVLIGAWLAELTAGFPLHFAPLVALGDTAEAVLVWALVRRWLGARPIFGSPHHVARFALAAAVGCFVAAANGALWLSAALPAPRHMSNDCITWWVGDLSGLLLVVALVEGWRQAQPLETLARRLEAALLLGSAAAGAGLLFCGWVNADASGDLLYLLLLFVLWAGLRFGLREVALTLLLVLGVAVRGTLRGDGPFGDVAAPAALLRLQGFNTVLALAALLLAAVFAENRATLRALRDAHDDLEHRVEERTAQLAESEQRHRLLFDLSPDPIFIRPLDTDGGPVVFTAVNEAACRHLGYSRSELLGLGPADIDVATGPSGTPAALRDLRVTGQALWESAHRRRDGRLVPIELHTHVVDVGGRRMVLHHVRDISDRRREQARREQDTKLHSLGLMAAGIAHDFNNLLTGVMGNAEIAIDALDEPELVHDCLLEITGGARRAAAICAQILAYTGSTPQRREPVDISDLCRQSLDAATFDLLPTTNLEVHLAGHPPLVAADFAQLCEVLLELVANAREAIGEEPGTITVRTASGELEPDALPGLSFGAAPGPGRYVWLEVTDTGAGMEEDTQRRIFDPFFSTHFLGRGLGLAAVLGIVRAHGGLLTVNSAPGRGTAMRVCLPAAAGLAGRGVVVLAMTKDHDRDAAWRVLQQCGYAVVAVRSGEEAQAVVRQGLDPDCLLLTGHVARGHGAALRALARPGAAFVVCGEARDLDLGPRAVVVPRSSSLAGLTTAVGQAVRADA